MGRLIYFMITSLDGFVADREGGFGWGQPSEEVLAVINEETAPVGTFLYGRKIYELMQVWETDPAIAADSPGSTDFARIWQRAEKIVFSTTLPEVATTKTRLLREFDPAAVRVLKEQSAADLTIEGPTLAAQALRHSLVDEIGTIICPLALGGGLRFLPDMRLPLELTEQRSFDNGMVQLRYNVTGG